MVSKINDNRIGIKANSRILQWPTYFANGGYWNRQNVPSPTMVYFGPERQYFYVLSIGTSRLDPRIREELEDLIYDAIAADEVDMAAISKQNIASATTEMATSSKTPIGDVTASVETLVIRGMPEEIPAKPTSTAFSPKTPRKRAAATGNGSIVTDVPETNTFDQHTGESSNTNSQES